VPFVRQLVAAKLLSIKIWTAADEQLSYDFDLADFTMVLGEVRQACNW